MVFDGVPKNTGRHELLRYQQDAVLLAGSIERHFEESMMIVSELLKSILESSLDLVPCECLLFATGPIPKQWKAAW